MRRYIVGSCIEKSLLTKKTARNALINALRQDKQVKGFNSFNDAFLYAYMLDHKDGVHKTGKVLPIFTIEYGPDYEGTSKEFFEYAKYVSDKEAKNFKKRPKQTTLKYLPVASLNIDDEQIIRTDLLDPNVPPLEFVNSNRSKLTWRQKQDILIDYIESYIDEEYEKTYIDKNSYKVFANRNNHLVSNVVKQIPSNELHPLIYDSYERLNKKYQFNNNESKKLSLSFAIKNITYKYHSIELEQSKKRALTSTLLFCLFIVTIPFAALFYKNKLSANYRSQDFQELAVDDDIVELRDQKEGKDKVYGLDNKIIVNAKSDFKEVLFNKKHEVRKHLGTGRIGSNGYMTLFGTKRQLEDSERKFQACINSDVPEQNTHSFKR